MDEKNIFKELITKTKNLEEDKIIQIIKRDYEKYFKDQDLIAKQLASFIVNEHSRIENNIKK